MGGGFFLSFPDFFDMSLVDILVRDHDYLRMSRPVYRKVGGGNVAPMFDIQRAGSAFGIPSLYKGGGRVQLNNHWLDAVIWAPHFISIHEKLPATDAISFEFSGCVMAVFCLRGTWYSAHIQMGEYDRTLDWISFIRGRPNERRSTERMRADLTALGMFRPDGNLLNSIPKEFQDSASVNDVVQMYAHRPHLWGIITSDGRFVSLCVYPLDESFQHFKVLSVERHPLSMDPRFYDSLFDSFQTMEAAKACWDKFWEGHSGEMLYECHR